MGKGQEAKGRTSNSRPYYPNHTFFMSNGQKFTRRVSYQGAVLLPLIPDYYIDNCLEEERGKVVDVFVYRIIKTFNMKITPKTDKMGSNSLRSFKK